jgi:hypothetical protein
MRGELAHAPAATGCCVVRAPRANAPGRATEASADLRWAGAIAQEIGMRGVAQQVEAERRRLDGPL